MKPNLNRAFQEWETIVGKNNIAINKPTSTRNITAIIKPKTVSEAQECVKVANQYRVAIYPISSGKNWGYGHFVPDNAQSCVVLHLEKLNRILEYNDELGYITIETGVTQKQVAEFLYQQHSKFFLSVTGSAPDTSVIANILERGDGSSIYPEKCQRICDLQIILSSGEIIYTGYRNFTENTLSKIHSFGIGAQVDGLFLQSNFGIITQMTIWLSPIPNYFQLMNFEFSDEKTMASLIESIRKLKLADSLKSTVSIWNHHKLQTEKSKWQGCAALYSASQSMGIAERRLIKSAMPFIKLRFAEYHYDEIIKWLYAPPKLSAQTFQKFLTLMKFSQCLGIPNEKNIACMFRDDNQLLGAVCICVAVPLMQDDVAKAIKIIESTADEKNFKPRIALLCVAQRYLIIPTLIIYDEKLPGEDEKAKHCQNLMLERLMQQGYFPTRLGLQTMHILSQAETGYKVFMNQLKQTLDPFNIIAPERYSFGTSIFPSPGAPARGEGK